MFLESVSQVHTCSIAYYGEWLFKTAILLGKASLEHAAVGHWRASSFSLQWDKWWRCLAGRGHGPGEARWGRSMSPRSFLDIKDPKALDLHDLFPQEHNPSYFLIVYWHTLFPDEWRSEGVRLHAFPRCKWRQREMACLVQDCIFLGRSLSPLYNHHI